MFTAALFTTAKTCKQSNCPPTDEGIKAWHVYQGTLLSWEEATKRATGRDTDEPRMKSVRMRKRSIANMLLRLLCPVDSEVIPDYE